MDDEWNLKTGQGSSKAKTKLPVKSYDSDYDLNYDSDDDKLAAIASSVTSEKMEDGELDEDEDPLDEALFGIDFKL